MNGSPRRLAFWILALSVCGCAATWQPVRHDRIASELNEKRPAVARVDTSGALLEVHRPVVHADTLRGTVQTARRNDPVSIPLASIESLSLARRNPVPTVIVGGAVLFSFVILASIVSKSSPSVP